MFSENKYEKLVFYMEACYSGTMFEQYLPKDHNVWAITAVNTHESSYAAFYDRRRRTYLADEFSANWMKDTETHGNTQTLYDQFLNVKRTTKHSHVMVYGDVDGMGKMTIGDFQAGDSSKVELNTTPLPPMTDAVPSYDVSYMSLYHQLEDAKTTQERLEILHEMNAELKAQQAIRERMEDIVGRLSSKVDLLMQYNKDTTTTITTEQHECYEQTVQKYFDTCQGFDEFDHNTKHLHVFSNLCTQGKTTESIVKAIEQVC
jgi:legumain